MHVIDMIFFWADMEPSRPAIMLSDRMLTYRALANAIEAIAPRIAEHNPDKQAPIAVVLDNEASSLAASLAVLRAGFNVALATPAQFQYLIESGTTTAITERNSDLPINRIPFDDSWLAGGMIVPSPRDPKNYGDAIFFTSGTTGRPKKSMETSEADIARAQISLFWRISEHARSLILPGLSTIFGFNLACDILRLGKTACFCPLGERTLWMIGAFNIESIHASSQQALTLCQLAESHREYSLSSLRTIRIGGSLPSKSLIDRIRSRLCKEVAIIYASTEGGQAATAPYAAIEHVEDAVGVVVPWTELQVVDNDDNPLPAGAVGRLRYRNEFYLKNKAGSSSDESRNAWFYPGDLGLVTADDILCIKGRSDDVINRGGVKLAAARVEERLMSCPGVKDAGVCGIEGLSEITQLWIAVVPDRDFKPAEFRHFVQTDEALHESLGTDIDQVFIVEDIPRGELGKIKRIDLRNKLLDMLKAAMSGAQ